MSLLVAIVILGTFSPTSSLRPCPQSPPTDFFETTPFHSESTYSVLAKTTESAVEYFPFFANIEINHICTKYTLDYANRERMNFIVEGPDAVWSSNDSQFIYEPSTRSFTHRYTYAFYTSYELDTGYKFYRLSGLTDAFAIYKCLEMPVFNDTYENAYIFFGFSKGMDSWWDSTVAEAVKRLQFSQFKKKDFDRFYLKYDEKCKIQEDELTDEVQNIEQGSDLNATKVMILMIPGLLVIAYCIWHTFLRKRSASNNMVQSLRGC